MKRLAGKLIFSNGFFDERVSKDEAVHLALSDFVGWIALQKGQASYLKVVQKALRIFFEVNDALDTLGRDPAVREPEIWDTKVSRAVPAELSMTQ